MVGVIAHRPVGGEIKFFSIARAYAVVAHQNNLCVVIASVIFQVLDEFSEPLVRRNISVYAAVRKRAVPGNIDGRHIVRGLQPLT